MADTIEENAAIILRALSSQGTDEMGRAMLSGSDLTEITDLLPAQINNAATILVEGGLAEWVQTLGTAPYIFHEIGITPRGRYEFERLEQDKTVTPEKAAKISRAPTPVGSPYGFTDEDWEIVTERKSEASRLYVVLGHQFKSQYFNSGKLKENIESNFKQAIEDYRKLPGAYDVELQFQPLVAGYGEHLFNEIARAVISSDIAVFDTSDQNANVMLEMGVALTWGVRVLPIKLEGCPKPPSDISGQTWADYRDSASEFIDPDHRNKLLRMVDRAIRKKGRA